MKLWRLRRNMYRTARVIGDLEAVARGPRAIARRGERRIIWRLVARALRKI